MADREIDRQTLRDWIDNDGLEHLLEEGYLWPEGVVEGDPMLSQVVMQVFLAWKSYEERARQLYDLLEY